MSARQHVNNSRRLMSVINVFATGPRKNGARGNDHGRQRLHKHPENRGVFLLCLPCRACIPTSGDSYTNARFVNVHFLESRSLREHEGWDASIKKMN